MCELMESLGRLSVKLELHRVLAQYTMDLISQIVESERAVEMSTCCAIRVFAVKEIESHFALMERLSFMAHLGTESIAL